MILAPEVVKECFILPRLKPEQSTLKLDAISISNSGISNYSRPVVKATVGADRLSVRQSSSKPVKMSSLCRTLSLAALRKLRDRKLLGTPY